MEILLHRGYKYRIFPTEDQRSYFMQTFGCRRKVYNVYVNALYSQLEAQGYRNGYIRMKDLTFVTPATLKKQFPYMKDVDSLALCNAQLDFKNAVQRFNQKYDKQSYTKGALKRQKTLGIHPTFRDLRGMPRFKRAKNGDFSYTTNNQSVGGRWPNITLKDGWLHIPKLKTNIKARMHRKLPENSIIKNATISMDSRGWFYVSLGVEFVREIEPVVSKTFLGLNYAQQDFCVDSENMKANYPHCYRMTELRLMREQRKLSHMVNGSRNWEKQRRRVTNLHGIVGRQRQDWLHKKSTAIANQYDMVAVEDIDLIALRQTLHHANNLHNGYGMFRTMLQYKMEERGKLFIKIDRSYPSSALCHCCGYVYAELEQNASRWICPCCGESLERDYNAAINIREAGKATLEIA